MKFNFDPIPIVYERFKFHVILPPLVLETAWISQMICTVLIGTIYQRLALVVLVRPPVSELSAGSSVTGAEVLRVDLPGALGFFFVVVGSLSIVAPGVGLVSCGITAGGGGVSDETEGKEG